jgi:N-acetylmuramoyl-L-alanine amidase-like protein
VKSPPATDAAWIGGARTFQLRVRGPLRGLRAHVVTAGRAGVRNAPVARRAAGDAPPIVTRAQWGAAAPRAQPSYGDVQLAFVHHTVSLNDYTPEDSPAIVRGIQRYHQKSNGWNDIGYNFLVDRYGTVFEGRAGGIDQPVTGAQAQGYNSASTGVASIGTHSSEPLTAEAFEAVASIVAWKLSFHQRPTEGAVTVTSAGGASNRYASGRRVTLQRISGHRDGDSTSCPGQALYDQLPALRQRASELAFSTGLSLRPAKGRVEYLASTPVTGRYVPPDGISPAGVPVEVQARTASGWSTIATAVTEFDGVWGAQIALPVSRSLRARIVTAPDGTTQRSPVVRLEVRPRIHTKLSARRLRVGKRAAVRVRVEPRKARQKVVLTLDRRKAGGGYRRVLRLRATARKGTVRVRLPLLRSGLVRITVTTPKDRLSAPGRQGGIFLRVRR